jgi:glycosyltransferase involved in cell wall biosynthesis
MRQAKDFGIADRVEFVGAVAEAELPTVLEWADLGLYASRRESFGVAPLEMMALARAALAHRIGGLTEVIKEGTTGDFVESLSPKDWADALEPLVLNPARVRTWGRHGPEWVRSRYNFEDNVQEMLAVYAHVLRSAPGP